MLHTLRLKLRPIEISDLEFIHSLLVLPETDEFNTLGIPSNIDVTANWISDWIEENGKKVITAYTFAICLKDPDKLIGLISIKQGNPKYKMAEIWFKLHADSWGHGYATEALKEVILFGFKNLSLHRIQAGCAVDNIASMRVMEKVGMKQEGKEKLVFAPEKWLVR